MSNIYVTEPPYSGRVILETSKGEIEIELFAKECPKACRNLIQLALEGYYDGLIFHRLVRNFIIQTGDPTGTGLGGESIYGQPFQDEFHQRLRFNRRGMLGMANASSPHSNDSQFFLTLNATPELQGKHTMFGRVVGQTIYSLVNLAQDVEMDKEIEDRPRYPLKLKTIHVVENPFEDIVPRVTREEKRAQARAKREADARKAEREASGKGGKKKNTALLSFGGEEEGEEGADDQFKGKPKSSHDLLANDKRLSKKAHAEARQSSADAHGREARGSENTPQLESKSDSAGPSAVNGHSDKTDKKRDKAATSEAREEEGLASLRDKMQAADGGNAAASKIADLEASIRGLSKRTTSAAAAQEEATKKKENKGKSLLQEMRAQYASAAAKSQSTGKAKGKEKDKDEETSDLLKQFQSRMRKEEATEKRKRRKLAEEEAEGIPDDLREYGASDEDEDDDKGWRDHRFDFGGKSILEDKHDSAEYVTLDPRDSTSSKALELGFGGREAGERAKAERVKQQGRRGRDWVDEREWDKRRPGDRPRDRDARGDERDSCRGGQYSRDGRSPEPSRASRMDRW